MYDDLYARYAELCHRAKRRSTLSITEFASLPGPQKIQLIEELEKEMPKDNGQSSSFSAGPARRR
ncbi:MAG: hypothetical protein LBT46_00610 [Planctomycetaceae bacterium]|nr:hypothetical protein [Planctomycetaceae bacterium]